jgi:hypothetical protein
MDDYRSQGDPRIDQAAAAAQDAFLNSIRELPPTPSSGLPTGGPLATLALIELRKAISDAQAIGGALPAVALHPDTLPEVGDSLEVGFLRLEVIRSPMVQPGEALVIRRDLLAIALPEANYPATPSNSDARTDTLALLDRLRQQARDTEPPGT